MNTNHLFSPLELKIILQYYVGETNFCSISTAFFDAQVHLLDVGFLERNRDNPDTVSRTERLIAYVNMVLSTPLPVWADPREDNKQRV